MAMEVTPRGRLLEGWDVPMDSSGGVQSLDGLGLGLGPDVGFALDECDEGGGSVQLEHQSVDDTNAASSHHLMQQHHHHQPHPLDLHAQHLPQGGQPMAGLSLSRCNTPDFGQHLVPLAGAGVGAGAEFYGASFLSLSSLPPSPSPSDTSQQRLLPPLVASPLLTSLDSPPPVLMEDDQPLLWTPLTSNAPGEFGQLALLLPPPAAQQQGQSAPTLATLYPSQAPLDSPPPEHAQYQSPLPVGFMSLPQQPEGATSDPKRPRANRVTTSCDAVQTASAAADKGKDTVRAVALAAPQHAGGIVAAIPCASPLPAVDALASVLDTYSEHKIDIRAIPPWPHTWQEDQTAAKRECTIRTVWCLTEPEVQREWKAGAEAQLQASTQQAATQPTTFALECGFCGFQSERHYHPRILAEIVGTGKGGCTLALSNDAIVGPFGHHVRTMCPVPIRETIGRVPRHAVQWRLQHQCPVGTKECPFSPMMCTVSTAEFDLLVRAYHMGPAHSKRRGISATPTRSARRKAGPASAGRDAARVTTTECAGTPDSSAVGHASAAAGSAAQGSEAWPILSFPAGRPMSQWERLSCDAAFFQSIAAELLAPCAQLVTEQTPKKQRGSSAASHLPQSVPHQEPLRSLKPIPLQSLILTGNVTNEVLQAVLQLVQSGTCRLEHLGLSHHRFGRQSQQGGAGLSGPLGSSELGIVASILAAPYAPVHVDLEGNDFTTEDAQILAEAIARSRRLQSVAWAGNPMGIDALLFVARALESKRQLRYKRLHSQEITYFSFGPSARSAASVPADASSSSGGDSDPLYNLLDARPYELTHFELWHVAISPRAWDKLDLNVLCRSQSLRQLILRSVQLDDARVADLTRWLTEGGRVEVLDLRDNLIGCPGATALAGVLAEGTVSFCNLTGNPIRAMGRHALVPAVEGGRARMFGYPFPLLQLELSATPRSGDQGADVALLEAARRHGHSFKLVLHQSPTRSHPLPYRWVPERQIVESVWPVDTKWHPDELSADNLNIEDLTNVEYWDCHEPSGWHSTHVNLDRNQHRLLTGT